MTAPLMDLEARILSLLGPIDAPEVNLLIDLLLRCDADSGKEITVYISCQGGDIIQGLKLVDTLRLLRSPVTAVGFGLVEGAGLILLTVATRRILLPSTLLSTAGLWTLPPLHREISQAVGLHPGLDPRLALVTKLRQQAERALVNLPGPSPSFLADPGYPAQIVDAVEGIALGLADHLITGAERRLHKPLAKNLSHAPSNVPHI